MTTTIKKLIAKQVQNELATLQDRVAKRIQRINNAARVLYKEGIDLSEWLNETRGVPAHELYNEAHRHAGDCISKQAPFDPTIARALGEEY